jgi:hypothetical protein
VVSKSKEEKKSGSKGKLQTVWAWLRRRDWTDFIAALALTISLISLVHDLYPPPQRAKFTVFLDTPTIWHNPENVTEIDATGRIVNEGSLAGQILRWDLFIDVNMSYKPLFYTIQVLTAKFLKPEEECNFTLGRTLIGANETRLPDNAIRNCTAWFEYRDSSETRTAEGQVSYLA